LTDAHAAAAENAPPGWYPDPSTPVLVRWWDGTAWTRYTSPNQALDGALPHSSNPAYTSKVQSKRKKTWKSVALIVVIVLVAFGLVALAVVVAINAAINDWASNK
jgi:Protein of unknown function (DUF2510)